MAVEPSDEWVRGFPGRIVDLDAEGHSARSSGANGDRILPPYGLAAALEQLGSGPGLEPARRTGVQTSGYPADCPETVSVIVMIDRRRQDRNRASRPGAALPVMPTTV